MNQLSKYLLHEPLGRGSYGIVYHAHDQVLDVPRAVKVLHPPLVADPDFVKRFRDEARLVARLKHPHIIPVYDLGEDQGRIFLAMEYYPGGSLKDYLVNEGPLSFPRAVALLEQIASALDYAHQQGILHRDLKPQNILLDTQGNAALTDFGFAKALSGAGSTGLSSTGSMIGTPAYMPPEVWDGKGWTSAADVYSLACVFFEMITGQVLFEGESPVQVMKKHVLGPQFPVVWPEGCPEELHTVLEKGLTENVAARFASAGKLVEGVNEVGQGRKEDEEARVITSEKPSLPPWDEETKKELVVEPTRYEKTPIKKQGSGVLVWGWVTASIMVIGISGIIILLFLVQNLFSNQTETPIPAFTQSVSQEDLSIYTLTPSTIIEDQSLQSESTEIYHTPVFTPSETPNSPIETPVITQPDEKPSLLREILEAISLVNINRLVELGRISEWENASTISDFEWSPQGNVIAIAHDRALDLLYLDTWSIDTFLENSCCQISFSSDGKSLATLNNDGGVAVWDLSTKVVTTHIEALTDYRTLTSIDFSPVENGLIAAHDFSDRVNLYYYGTRAQYVFDEEVQENNQVLFSPDGTKFASHGMFVYIWDLQKILDPNPSSKKADIKISGHSGAIEQMAFNKNWTILATSSYQELKLWDATNGKLIRSYPKMDANVTKITFSQDSTFLAVGLENGKIQIWNVGDGTHIISLDPDSGKISDLEFSPDGMLFATSTSDGNLILWGIPPSP